MSTARALTLTLLVALVVRVLVLLPFLGVTELQGDEIYYLGAAEIMLESGAHPGSFRPPLYTAVVAAVLGLFDGSRLALQVVQIAISLVTVAAVFTIVRRRFDVRAALLSGLACALVPSQAHYAHFFWSECLASALLMTFFAAWSQFELRGRTAWLIAAGALLGVTALVRETWILFAGLLAALMLFSEPGGALRRAGRAAALVGAALLIVLPWTARNQAVHGEFVLISTCRWFPMAIGNLLPKEGQENASARQQLHRRRTSEMSETDAERYWRDVALKSIAREQPGWLLFKLRENVPLLFSLRSQPIRFLRNGWMPTPGPVAGRFLVGYDVLGYLAVMTLGLCGLWVVPGDRFKLVVVAAIALTIGLHVAANATARFVVPLMPLIALYAGPLVAGHARGAPRWRRVAAAVTCTAFLGVALSSWGSVTEVLALW